MLHNRQRLTHCVVQGDRLQRRLYGREPCGISRRRCTVLRFQGLLILGYAVLNGVPRGAVQGAQKAAETLTDGCQLRGIRRRRQRLGLASSTLRPLRRQIRVQGREECLAFGHPFIGQGTELVGTPLFYAHGTSPGASSCRCLPSVMKSSPSM